jgi:threonine dehydrogenase-like Zn-dependent dehydrogenase
MRAVTARLSTPRYVWTTLARRVRDDAGWRAGGLLRLQPDLPEPRLPEGDGWVRLRPELAGICGSDVAFAHAKTSLVLSAFYAADTAVLGHEIVAVVDRVGPGVRRVAEGDRVVVDPVLSCRHRGFEPVCRTCAEGYPYVCERFDQPGRSGMRAATLGFDTSLGGGWGEVVVAHESQLYPVGRMPSQRAVLAEPASIALHAALQWTRRGDRAVVIGPGTIGLLVTAALRMLHPDLDVAVVSPGEFGARQALAAGASRTLPGGAGAVQALADADGGRVLRPRLTALPLLERGVDVVLDCVGSPDTIDLSLHLLRPTGMLVLVGAAGRQDVDWSLVWNRQLTVQGTINFGPEPALAGRHTMAQVVEWLADPAYSVDHLVTHTLPLDDWEQALSTASAGPAANAVKVTLRPDQALPLVQRPVAAAEG